MSGAGRPPEFVQEPPRLGNQYRDDRVLRSFLARSLPPEVHRAAEPTLDEMGGLAGGRLYELAQEHRLDEPVHVPYDPWGRRIDEVRVNAAWREYSRVAAEHGLVAIAYERTHGPYSRLHQFALAYLFSPSSQTYTCPLAMTDGCARTLELLAATELRERILSRLTSRDPHRAWTSGQWMTERIGGSDVALTETVARQTPNGWRLWGTKWFTSAVTAPVALTLARPEGNPPGGKGLALFLVELRSPDGGSNGITVLRLKDKLGTRQLPTAELRLEGTLGQPLAGLAEGIRSITTMLNLTRTWNSVVSAATLRRGLALARDYARRRTAFGATLAEKPLHLETLADLAADHAAAFHLAFRAVALIGEQEAGELDARGEALLRLLQPVVKLSTARQAVTGASESLEAIGGLGYIESTGLPELLRDAQVLPIWEGTTNVLALEAIRAIHRVDALGPYLAEVRSRASNARHPSVLRASQVALSTADRAEAWWDAAGRRGAFAVEAHARRFVLTLARTLALALIIDQAQWSIDHEQDGRMSEAARRFADHGVDLLSAEDPDGESTRRLALDD